MRLSLELQLRALTPAESRLGAGRQLALKWVEGYARMRLNALSEALGTDGNTGTTQVIRALINVYRPGELQTFPEF